MVVLLCAGCTGNHFSADMASWQGRHIDEVASAWGDPSECVPADGQTVCSWDGARPTRLDSVLSGAGTTGQALQSRPSCLKMLAIDQSGYVTGWRWRGDRCPDSGTVARVN